MTTSRSRLGVFLAHASYTVCLHLACLLAVPPWLVRLWRDPRQAAWIRQRLGRLPEGLPGGRPIWVHAVSVGEVKASRPLVRALREQYPDIPVVISVGTLTGFETARRTFPELFVFPFPLDFPWVVSSVVRRVDPRLLVLLELEVWPSLMRVADRLGVPQVILNGRVSESSFRSYRRLRWWLPEFDRIDLVAAQTELYADRIRQLGVPAERVYITGNLKHDLIGGTDAGAAAALRDELGLGTGRPVFVAGSTHEGEDEAVIRAWSAAGGAELSQLILVPRHLERLKEIGRLCRRLEVPFRLRSASGPTKDAEGLLLVDTMGELESFFALADLVFLGGSLVPVGGHNVLEPAAAGCPVLVGPYLETCRREADILEAAGALLVAADGGALGRLLVELLGDPDRRESMGRAAREAVAGLQGASRADLDVLRSRGLLPESPVDAGSECSNVGRPSGAPGAQVGPGQTPRRSSPPAQQQRSSLS